MSDCLICFCPIEGLSVSCGEIFCNARICTECFPLLISYSESEKVIPQCPNKNCKGFYMLKDIKKISNKETLHSYNNACFQAIIKSKGELAKKANEQQDILNKLRKERKQFLKENFPVSIYTVATVAFPAKLRRIEKQRAEHISDQLNASNRLCMNLSCMGHLDKDMICMVCETEFCRKCEDILQEGHICNTEMLESLNFIGTLTKCPKCSIAIQRSEGCNNMSCTNCGEKFLYSTGESGGYGSVNQKTPLHNYSKFSDVYRDTMTAKIMTLILEFEAKKPHVMSEKVIINSLQKVYRKNSDIDISAKEITLRFNNYMLKIYAMKKYQKVARSVENMLRKNDLTVSFIKEAIKVIS
jgi:hypothetical protein